MQIAAEEACSGRAEHFGFSAVEPACAESESAVFVRLVEKRIPETERSDEIDVKPTVVGGWLVLRQDTAIDDLAAQLCDRMAWANSDGSHLPSSGTKRKKNGKRGSTPGEVSRDFISDIAAEQIRRSNQSFFVPGKASERFAFAGI